MNKYKTTEIGGLVFEGKTYIHSGYKYNRYSNDCRSEIVAVTSDVMKSNSSSGRWVIHIEIATPLGNGRQNSYLFFWRKSEAVEARNYLLSQGVVEA